MNAGVVSTRYARALLEFTAECGSGESVYNQVYRLLRTFKLEERLRNALENPNEVSLPNKLSLMEAALGEAVDPSLVKFVTLVYNQRRVDILNRIFISFVELYHAAHRIMVGTLTTAVHVEGLKERIEKLLREKTGAEVYLEEMVSEGLIGGYIVEINGYRMDASLKYQLEKIRKELVEANFRIV